MKDDNAHWATPFVTIAEQEEIEAWILTVPVTGGPACAGVIVAVNVSLWG